jgi:tRNA pseudouridine55 synthase
VGEGLKLSRFFLENHPGLPTYWKSYLATMKLGVATAALDPVTEVVATAPVPLLTAESVEAAVSGFRGAFTQVPPDYSAKKIDGKRASDRVRNGESVEMKAVSVVVRELTVRRIAEDEIEFDVTCSKGTYVRALARDIAAALGTVGHLTQLSRTAVGAFLANDAVNVETAAWTQGSPGFVELVALCAAVLPGLIVTEDEAAHLRAGRSTMVFSRLADWAPSPYYAMLANGTPVALLERNALGQWALLRGFVAA